jgi:hypothetical protein
MFNYLKFMRISGNVQENEKRTKMEGGAIEAIVV